MTIGTLRSILYGTARALGDVQSVRNGTVAKRLARRAAGRVTAGILGRLFR